MSERMQDRQEQSIHLVARRSHPALKRQFYSGGEERTHTASLVDKIGKNEPTKSVCSLKTRTDLLSRVKIPRSASKDGNADDRKSSNRPDNCIDPSAPPAIHQRVLHAPFVTQGRILFKTELIVKPATLYAM